MDRAERTEKEAQRAREAASLKPTYVVDGFYNRTVLATISGRHDGEPAVVKDENGRTLNDHQRCFVRVKCLSRVGKWS
jgi:hypothetical protein